LGNDWIWVHNIWRWALHQAKVCHLSLDGRERLLESLLHEIVWLRKAFWACPWYSQCSFDLTGQWILLPCAITCPWCHICSLQDSILERQLPLKNNIFSHLSIIFVSTWELASVLPP
jgi:hypothetical protein